MKNTRLKVTQRTEMVLQSGQPLVKMKWNPEHNFEDGNNKIHVQCRKNIKLINEAFKE